MTLKRSIGSTALLITLALISNALQAACKERDVIAALESGGFTYSITEGGENFMGFSLTRHGTKSVLYVEIDDGDLSFRKYFTDDVRLSTLNSVNDDYKYVKVSRDDDDDIEVAYDYPHWGSGCTNELNNNIRFWFSLLDSVVEELSDKL